MVVYSNTEDEEITPVNHVINKCKVTIFFITVKTLMQISLILASFQIDSLQPQRRDNELHLLITASSSEKNHHDIWIIGMILWN